MPRIELDPSLIGSGNGVNAFASAYQNALANSFKNQAAQQELDVNQFKMDGLRQEQEQSNKLAQLMASQGFDPRTPQGQAQMYGAGGVKRTQDFLKGQGDLAKVNADASKTTAETEKIQLEKNFRKLDLMGQLMGGVQDQSSYDQMRAQASKIPELADLVPNMPPTYDAKTIEIGRQKAMSVKDSMAARHQELTLAETGRHNVANEKNAQYGQQVTMRGQDMTAATAGAGQQITMRGQNMTDARSRELNDTRIEDNRIKREAKDDTNNLTKQGQLASFDTMLGTLDRLGKHPGLSRSVGMIGVLPTMPGSDSANFQAELNTFQSQAFLPMVAQLKGMGALSDAEGKKLTAAVGALDPKMGEKAFRESVQRITDDMTAAKGRMLTNGKSAMPQANQDSAAVAWAKANPNDPRAAKIMQLQGR